jgi:hypothetical protein
MNDLPGGNAFSRYKRILPARKKKFQARGEQFRSRQTESAFSTCSPSIRHRLPLSRAYCRRSLLARFVLPSRAGIFSSFLRKRSMHFVSHSQITSTRHLARRSAFRLAESRATFLSNFSDQNRTFVDGIDAFWQSLCLCQKQPCTKIAKLYFGRTRSGHPGKSDR